MQNQTTNPEYTPTKTSVQSDSSLEQSTIDKSSLL